MIGTKCILPRYQRVAAASPATTVLHRADGMTYTFMKQDDQESA